MEGIQGKIMTNRELLESVKNNQLSLEEAEQLLETQVVEDLGYAKLDHNRQDRQGFGEVVFCQGKEDRFLKAIFKRLVEREDKVMGTRASLEQYKFLKEEIKELAYDEVSKIIQYDQTNTSKIGNIVVCTAGTADIPVAEEAAQTAEFFGGKVERVYDVGVAGIHRLFSKLEIIQGGNCIVSVAGMEGALSSVIGGLVDVPVIAVPTSIGYGANFHGLSALLTMINSCSNGIATVNIDNGYGAGYLATQINRLAVNGGIK